MLNSTQKKSILFLWLDDKEFHSVNAKRRGVLTSNVFKKIPKFLKVLRRLQIILGWFSVGIWLGSWKDKLKDFETVIIHASKLTPPVVKYINKNNPNIRIIVWYWNPVDKCEKLEKFPADICERWCFDEEDSRKYNIPHNTQYYFNDIFLPASQASTDVYFLGGDKGRLKQLLEIENSLESKGLVVDFHITKSGKNDDKNFLYKSRISYRENLEKISGTNAILDIVSGGQHGLTLRPLEAMYFNKKLITNDENLKNFDFYHPSNIFILNNNLDDLPIFLEVPYHENEVCLTERYDFDSWIYRFFI